MPFKKRISHMKTPEQNLFELHFPPLTGLSLVLDDFSRSPASPYYQTVMQRNIYFHNDPAYGVDPDAKLKLGFMMLIAAANKVDHGKVPFSTDPQEGRKPNAGFQDYMPLTHFLVFRAAVPFLWAPKNLWFTDKRDMPFEVFNSFHSAFNEVCSS